MHANKFPKFENLQWTDFIFENKDLLLLLTSSAQKIKDTWLFGNLQGENLHTPQTKGGLTAQESSEHSRPLRPWQLNVFLRNPGILTARPNRLFSNTKARAPPARVKVKANKLLCSPPAFPIPGSFKMWFTKGHFWTFSSKDAVHPKDDLGG